MEQDYLDSTNLLGSLPESHSPYARFVVIYDGACYFCYVTVRFLKKVDFLHKFSYVKLQEFSRLRKVKIPYNLLQESIHVVDRQKEKVWQSTGAISRLLLQSPPAFPLVILLMFLRLIRVAEPAYQWVARSRYTISAILRG